MGSPAVLQPLPLEMANLKLPRVSSVFRTGDVEVDQLRLDLVSRQQGHDLGRSDPLPDVANATTELFSTLAGRKSIVV